MSDLYLTDEEIKHITKRKYQGAQRKILVGMGYQVKDRPDGSFWVPRAQFFKEQDAQPPKAPKQYRVNLGALQDACA